MENENKAKKQRYALWTTPSTIALAESLYKDDNCASRSEFIEKAIEFYAGYLSSQKVDGYFPKIVTSTLKAIIDESDNRINRMLFKLAVELSITMNVVAATNEIDDDSLRRLRGTCVDEVKKINGTISFDDAARWQR